MLQYYSNRTIEVSRDLKKTKKNEESRAFHSLLKNWNSVSLITIILPLHCTSCWWVEVSVEVQLSLSGRVDVHK